MGARRCDKRNGVWIWTVALVGAAAGHGALQERRYGVYGCLPVNKHKVGKGGAVNRNDGLHSGIGRQAEQASEAHKRGTPRRMEC